MVDGIAYVRQNRLVMAAITLDLFAVLLAGATAMFPVFARDILDAGPEGAGLMRAAVALGSVAVAVGLAIRPIEHNVGVKMLWAVAVFGATTVAFGYSTSLLLSLALASTLLSTPRV